MTANRAGPVVVGSAGRRRPQAFLKARTLRLLPSPPQKNRTRDSSLVLATRPRKLELRSFRMSELRLALRQLRAPKMRSHQGASMARFPHKPSALGRATSPSQATETAPEN